MFNACVPVRESWCRIAFSLFVCVRDEREPRQVAEVKPQLSDSFGEWWRSWTGGVVEEGWSEKDEESE